LKANNLTAISNRNLHERKIYKLQRASGSANGAILYVGIDYLTE
jgi:hypothetical protein